MGSRALQQVCTLSEQTRPINVFVPSQPCALFCGSIGPDKGGYYHPSFLRGMISLAEDIPRISIKGKSPRKVVPSSSPNFYGMSPLPLSGSPVPPPSAPATGGPNSRLALYRASDTVAPPESVNQWRAGLGASIALAPSNVPMTRVSNSIVERVLGPHGNCRPEQRNANHVIAQRGIEFPNVSLGYVGLLLAASRHRRQAANLSSALPLLAMYDLQAMLGAEDQRFEAEHILNRFHGLP
jgi:hypothetical protein